MQTENVGLKAAVITERFSPLERNPVLCAGVMGERLGRDFELLSSSETIKDLCGCLETDWVHFAL